MIDNNIDFIQSLSVSEDDVKKYLQNMAITILNNPYFEEIIEGHLNPFTLSERKKIVVEKLSFIAGN